MQESSKIYVAGHRGLAGSAIHRHLERHGYSNLVTRTSQELDLRDRDQVYRFFEAERPEYIVLAAAKVGGIIANQQYPVEFLRDNIKIQTNVIEASYDTGVKKLLFLGSTCIYPKFAPQPLKEEYLLTGELEPTNDAYAIAKIAGIKLCQAYNRQYGTKYISAMPTNLYGPNDNFDLTSSHVLPALLRKFHEATRSGSKTVELWGTGSPLREFLHSDDLAAACVFLLREYEGDEIVNIGVGEDIAIKDLAAKIAELVGFEGDIVYDTTKPDGTPRKLVDVTRINSLGWKAGISLEEGLRSTYEWFKNNYELVKN